MPRKTKITLADKLRQPRLFTNEAPHLIVVARAGTGKTTTLVEGLREVKGIKSKLEPSLQQAAVWESMRRSADKVKSVCFAAFNVSIANELKKRVPEGCDAKTMHGLGYSAVKKAMGRNPVLNDRRVEEIICSLLNTDIYSLREKRPTLLNATRELAALCKLTLTGATGSLGTADWHASLEELSSRFDIDLNGDREKVYDLIPQVLSECKNLSSGMIDYADMIWLPIALNLPVFRYDLLLVDEGQDLNKCQQELALRAGRRLILCGDPKQALYGFAGADTESMRNMESYLSEQERGCEVLPLTVTRRCGKAIVEEAKKIVPDFEAFDSNPDGSIYHSMYKDSPIKPEIEQSCYRHFVEDGDMVLCRTNAHLVSQCFRFIADGRKANIQGRNVATALTSTVNKMKAKNVIDLQAKLSQWLHTETEREYAKRRPSDARLIALQDRYDCLNVFMEGQKTVDGVIKSIDKVFTKDNDKRGIRLSSVHRAKGLEADNVFLLEPEGAGIPHPMAKSAWQIEQEWCCRYVAITRARNKLVYVK